MPNLNEIEIPIHVQLIIGLSIFLLLCCLSSSGNNGNGHKPLTAQEQKEIEQNIINRYGSIENAEAEYRNQSDEATECFNPPLCR